MTAKLMLGDVRTRIKEIPDGSVDLVCTSPPFLALRKYGDNPEGEMGSEATPAAFIDGLLSLTAEFRRVLAPHGSIAVELGDTFSGSGGGGDYNPGGLRDGQERFDGSAVRDRRGRPDDLVVGWDNDETEVGTRKRQRIDTHPRDRREGRTGTQHAQYPLPANTGGRGWPLAKSLCLTPYLYPLGLAYGRNLLTGQPSPAGQWMVRNMICWSRPNPPVGDLADKVRPGTSYITVATTSPRRWFDLDAVRHDHVGGPHSVGSAMVAGTPRGATAGQSNPAGAPPLDWWDDDYDPTDPVDAYTLGHLTIVQATQPYKGSHFATWPSKLVHRLIMMMCPPKVCMALVCKHCGHRHEHLTEQLLNIIAVGRETLPLPASVQEELRYLWDVLRGQESIHVQPSLPGDSESEEPDHREVAGHRQTRSDQSSGVHSPTAAGSSGRSEGIPARAPLGHGAEGRSTAGEVGTRPSSQRGERRQPPREPGHRGELATPRHRDVSSLRERLLSALICSRHADNQRGFTVCGVPSERIVEIEYTDAPDRPLRPDDARRYGSIDGKRHNDHRATAHHDQGWTDCGHDSWRQGCVLDPFAGSGTTLAVATGCGRDAIGIELYEHNAHLIRERVGMFLEEVA